MKEKIKKIINSFASEDGLNVIKTIFAVFFIATTIEFLITDSIKDFFVPAFALFSILASVIFFKKKKVDTK